MPYFETIKFIFRFTVIGLAIAFIVLLINPQIFRSTVLGTSSNLPPMHSNQLRKNINSLHTSPVKSNGLAFSYADAVNITTPAVVSIYTFNLDTSRSKIHTANPIPRKLHPKFSAKQIRIKPKSLGSGVIFSKQGFILTNNHVISSSKIIEVMLKDGRTARAQLVGKDPDTDLAVLKIKLKALPSIKLGDSSRVRVGDVVLAIGNPYDVGQTVTQGIVSATGRKGLGLNTYENFIQTDAAINPGNSGGALINPRGELVGISTAIFSRTGGSQGIGFVIPVNLAKKVMNDIIKQGEVIRGWLGVIPEDMNIQLAKRLGFNTLRGVIITNMYKNGPAFNSGLTLGDIITSFNRLKIINSRHLMDLVADQKPGSRIMVSGIRNKRPFSVAIIVGKRPMQSK